MATEKRLIDANDFLAELKVDHDDIMQSPNVDKQMKWCEAVTFGRTVNALVKQPTVDAVEVVHGRWENFGEHRRKDLRCSICGNRADKFVGGTEDWYCLWEPNYCPNCGADMRERKDNG